MISELVPDPQPLETDLPPQQTILLVEDDPDQGEALSLQLKSQGFEVELAATATEAIDLAAKNSPSLALVDIGLPDMSGWDLCRQLVDNLCENDLPVIALSGTDQQRSLHRSRASGCRYFVRKPYDPNALLVLIESALRDDGLW